MQERTKSGSRKDQAPGSRLMTVVGIVLCVILIPILVINCTLLIKGYTNSDRVPTIGGVFPMIVLTDSMYPEFSSGDLIVCKTLKPQQVKVGDIISYYDPESASGKAVVTHRVLAVNADANGVSFQTKGDFNNTADTLPIPAEKLVGIYTGIRIPGAGDVAMFMQTTQGLLVCVALPTVLLLGYDYLRRRRYEKKHDQDKEQLLAELAELRRLKAEQTQENP